LKKKEEKIMEPVATVSPAVATIPVTGVASPVPPSAARQLFSRGQEIVGAALMNKRPWSEMVDRSTFAKPESLKDAMSRLHKNLNYFRINYGILMLVVVALSLLVNPSSIFFIALVLAGWTYLFLVRKEPLIVFGRTFSEREVVLSMIGISIPLIVFSGIANVLLSAGLIGLFLVAAHGAFKVPDDLFLLDDDQEAAASSGGSFFPAFFLGSTGAAGSFPVAMSRV
jgi:hypothetical protein